MTITLYCLTLSFSDKNSVKKQPLAVTIKIAVKTKNVISILRSKPWRGKYSHVPYQGKLTELYISNAHCPLPECIRCNIFCELALTNAWDCVSHKPLRKSINSSPNKIQVTARQYLDKNFSLNHSRDNR